MHVAFVTTESPYGDAGACGIAAYLRAIIPAIVDAGHRVSVFANARERKDFSTEENRVKVHHFRLPSWHWYTSRVPLIRNIVPLPLRQLEWSKAFYDRVTEVAREEKIDVIEATEIGSLFLNRIAPLVIRLHGSELTFRRHSGTKLNLSVKWNDMLEGYGCERAAAITAPSNRQSKEISTHRGWSHERIQVIPNPVSGSMLNAALQFQRNGSTERLVLYAGRLAPVKGIDVLLEAAKRVHAQDPSIKFVLAGPWQMPRSPRAYGLGLERISEDGVQWVGPLNQGELIHWYKRAAICVVPSYYESFGIGAIEALAFGLPTIATDSSGVADIVGEHSLLLLVPGGDASSLAEKITDRVSRPNNQAAHDSARRHVAGNFTAERVASAMLKVYDSIRN